MIYNKKPQYHLCNFENVMVTISDVTTAKP
jgi:hypothetical protein